VSSAQSMIGIAQLNTRVGDSSGNTKKIIEAAKRAYQADARILLTPELSLSGYPLQDLVFHQDFLAHIKGGLLELAAALARECPDMVVLVGYPELATLEEQKDRLLECYASLPIAYNSVAVLLNGKIIANHRKNSLPQYGVFDEKRVFRASQQPTLFEFHGKHWGVLICEDVWVEKTLSAYCSKSVDILLVLNASPWHRQKKKERLLVLGEAARYTNCPVVYCNQVGAQDELIFDGSSCVIDADGHLQQQLPSFVEALALARFEGIKPLKAFNPMAFDQALDHPNNRLNDLYQALCLGVRDYVEKSGFKQVVLGLSGGVDSALTLAIAVDALGKERVKAVMLPSPYTSEMSLEDAKAMAEELGVDYSVIPINPVVEALLQQLSPAFQGKSPDLTEENLQARTRGLLLMALSNKHGELLLTTGNKSEMAVGYATLYGDMCGALAVLKDLTKHWVYALSHYRNTLGRVIPERILIRPPSAELRPDQTDQDTLPPYDILDRIVEGYVEEGLSIEALVQEGLDVLVVERIVRLIRLSEYKRQQSAIGLNVSRRAFGRDWRYPVVNQWKH
jgi:NAD+ synthase (glutamine-hydrolysing)